MIQLEGMQLSWDHFDTIKKSFLRELIYELEGLELPPEWKPRDVLGFVIRKLEDKEKNV